MSIFLAPSTERILSDGEYNPTNTICCPEAMSSRLRFAANTSAPLYCLRVTSWNIFIFIVCPPDHLVTISMDISEGLLFRDKPLHFHPCALNQSQMKNSTAQNLLNESEMRGDVWQHHATTL